MLKLGYQFMNEIYQAMNTRFLYIAKILHNKIIDSLQSLQRPFRNKESLTVIYVTYTLNIIKHPGCHIYYCYVDEFLILLEIKQYLMKMHNIFKNAVLNFS